MSCIFCLSYAVLRGQNEATSMAHDSKGGRPPAGPFVSIRAQSRTLVPRLDAMRV
jgi:hypothetical protein